MNRIILAFLVFLLLVGITFGDPLKSYSTKAYGVGKYWVSLKTQLAWTDGAFDIDGKYNSLTGSGTSYRDWTFLLYARTGLVENIEIALKAPYLINRFKITENRQNGSGIGDVSFLIKDNLLEESNSEAIPGISVLFEYKLATGKYKDLVPEKLGADKTGTGSTDVVFMGLFEKRFSNLVFYLNLAYGYSLEYSDIISGAAANVLNPPKLALSFSTEYLFNEGLTGMLEISALTTRKTKINGTEQDGTDVNLIEITAGASFYLLKDLEVLLGSSYALFGKNVKAPITPIVEIRAKW